MCSPVNPLLSGSRGEAVNNGAIAALHGADRSGAKAVIGALIATNGAGMTPCYAPYPISSRPSAVLL
ncbi:hypothetical protein NKI79_30805, partial [Mesorhizobium sp. M0340]|uniref:hypothetical protein n=1 Tax=Mesorhizobium sp. M0340 TaxID=2956939 RepID=UPI003336BBFF